MATPVESSEMDQQTVRFPSQDQQTSPEQSLQIVKAMTGKADRERDDLNPEAQQELQQLRTTLQNNMQSARMQHHAFEPVSLPGSQPASRVPSGATTPGKRQLPAGPIGHTPQPSPPTSAVHSPPLTPAATRSRDGKLSVGAVPHMRPAPDVMTPQRSASPQREDKPSGTTTTASGDAAAAVSAHPKPAPTFAIGGGRDSEEPSPSGTPASTAPGTPRPFTPSGKTTSDPVSRAKRLSRTQDSTTSRYRFGDRDPAQGFANSGQANVSLPNVSLPSAPTLPRSSATGASLKPSDDKRQSLFGGIKHSDDSTSTLNEKAPHSSSKANLKRFFKFGHDKHRDKPQESNGAPKEGTKTPPGAMQQPSVPFADDHGLASKYGKFGKMLGSGAGGSVRLMKRTGDGVVFAVKQFRDRHPYESERDYNKKVTAEFCIGSTLHHGNIIETIDIVHEKGKWYEVMEYAPFDLFATVMTGKMGREEITCSTLQILSGVLYLHSMGLAHRDLKLDNVVINDRGIMKLIDFGSAVVFRYPFENDIVLASGVVGSDPYLAPEVYDQARYDPRPADIWSIAIIFCCMTLRRFPWKAPRTSDNSYRLFISPPDPDQDKLLDPRRSVAGNSARNPMASVAEDRDRSARSEPASRMPSSAEDSADASSVSDQHHHHHHHHQTEPVSRTPTASEPNAERTIKGPVRLLRLLPRETRHIISRMLELDPRKRADMDEILQDPWVQNSLVCRQEEDAVIIKAPNHTHTLQPSNAGGNK